MRICLDAYSYHRMLGLLRAGEVDPGVRLEDGGPAIIAEANRLGVDAVSLETIFLEAPNVLNVARLRDELAELEVALAWGAPDGLVFGRTRAPLVDLHDWLAIAATMGCRTVKISAGGPALRAAAASEFRNTAPLLREAAEHAREVGIEIAVENHGDLTAAQLAELMSLVDDNGVGVCFDTVNAVRVGDDPLDAARRLAEHVRMLHLRDMGPPDESVGSVAGPYAVDFGKGIIPLDEILATIEESQFSVLVCVQLGQLAPGADEHTMIEAAVSWLRDRDLTGRPNV